MTDAPREQLEADAVIVGAGPAGLSCAYRLAELIGEHNRSGATPPLSAENILVLDKAPESGAHTLSGAVMDPRAIRELARDAEGLEALLSCPVQEEVVWYLTQDKSRRLPLIPPSLKNEGNYVVSLGRIVRWLADRVEGLGVVLLSGFAGRRLLMDRGRVAGVQTDDKGIGKDGVPKGNFEPGIEIRAKVSVLAEGARGSLTEELVSGLRLDEGRNPRTYGLGLKEVWQVPEGRIRAGTVWHSFGYPLDSNSYGGSWLYGLGDDRVSIGLVCGLHYRDPAFDPHGALQRLKRHRLYSSMLQGGRRISYGAKTISLGGYWALPQCVADGALVLGDGAGFVDASRLKGIHLAIRSGMLAAETLFAALKASDCSKPSLAPYERRVREDWMGEQLWRARNHHQALERGLRAGLGHLALQQITGGRGIRARYPSRPGHERMQKRDPRRSAEAPVQPDGRLTFSKAENLYHSGTHHEQDQPTHLLLREPDICQVRCAEEYGNPCQYFCPADVYRIERVEQAVRLKLQPANCLHCKTCDIMDPYRIIAWSPPEGGGGPRYDAM